MQKNVEIELSIDGIEKYCNIEDIEEVKKDLINKIDNLINKIKRNKNNQS